MPDLIPYVVKLLADIGGFLIGFGGMISLLLIASWVTHL
jgi:hypothetical protein